MSGIPTDNSTQLPQNNFSSGTPDYNNIENWSKLNNNIYNTSLNSVGIGTTNPNSFKLNVNGSIKASSFNGDGSSISALDWNKITLNKPSLYTTTQTDNLLNAKEAILTFSSPLTRTTNTIGINLSSYSTTGNDANYLLKTGGTMTGALLNTSTTTSEFKGIQIAHPVRISHIPYLPDGNIYFRAPVIIDNNADFLSFGSRTGDNFLRLYGTDYGFGINGSTLRYNVPAGAFHRFYHGTTNTAWINDAGRLKATTFEGSGSALTNIPYTALTGTAPFYTKGEADTLLNAKEQILTFSSPLTRSTNTIGINLNSYTPFTALQQSNYVNFPQLLSSNYAPFTALASCNYSTTSTLSNIFITSNVLSNTSNILNTAINTKETTLTFSSPLVRTINNITFNEASITTLTNFYNKTDMDGFITWIENNYYVKTSVNNLLNAKEAILTFSSPLIRTTNTISLNQSLISYTNLADKPDLNLYLLKSGGTMTGNLGIGTTNNANSTLELYSTSQLTSRIILSGQEFYTNTSIVSGGIAFLCGVNRTGNRQLWIGDSLLLTQNTTNPVLRINIGASTAVIDCIATNGTTSLPISFGNSSATTTINGSRININGIANIHNGNPVAVPYNYMASGSLTIGGSNVNYGGGTNWNANTAGLLMECADNTEIAVHDGGLRVASFMYYEGGINNNKITIGRNMGWGAISNVVINGNVGIQNTSPWVDLNLGNVAVGGSSGSLVFGKNNGAGGTRNFRQGMSSNFFFCVGDCGNVNNSSAVWTLQSAISYQAPASSFTISSTGTIIMPYSWNSSDERIKTNVKTIEYALDKVLLLRGVEYNDFRFEPDKKHIGLIAQEVELIIPEAVGINEFDNIKCISYNSIIGVLVEAVKQLNNKVLNLENIIKNNNLS